MLNLLRDIQKILGVSFLFSKGVYMADNKKQAIREIPRHDIHVKASTESRNIWKELGRGAMEEVVIPKSKEAVNDLSTNIINMFAEAARGLIEKILYPDGDAPRRRTSSNGVGHYTSNVNYTTFSKSINEPNVSSYAHAKGRDPIGQRPGTEVKYVWVESEDKAKEIVGALVEDIENYGKAKVATLYEMIGERTTHADFRFGWTDSNAIGYYYDTSRRGSEFKWFIDLPKPVDITNN